MKALLTRITGIYTLMKDEKMVASDDIDIENDYEVGKLSTEKSDEIFGVVDVEKLADTICNRTTENFAIREVWKDGFNKAMELNKAKEFTLEQVIEAMNLYRKNLWTMVEVLKNLKLQSTEIEVEVEMEESQEIYRDGTTKYIKIPKLDDNGCLILKKAE
jgi:hypothetical protein